MSEDVQHDRHDGPLRVLQPLHPEGPAICHHVLVHPPGGLVGGDVLDIDINVQPGAHALVTTPGATRCYRSTGETAVQSVRARIADGARLEWLPLEAIALQPCHCQPADGWQRTDTQDPNSLAAASLL